MAILTCLNELLIKTTWKKTELIELLEQSSLFVWHISVHKHPVTSTSLTLIIIRLQWSEERREMESFKVSPAKNTATSNVFAVKLLTEASSKICCGIMFFVLPFRLYLFNHYSPVVGARMEDGRLKGHSPLQKKKSGVMIFFSFIL